MTDDNKNVTDIILDELREHRTETRIDMREVFRRLTHLETTNANRAGAEEAERNGVARRAGIIAFVISSAIGVLDLMVKK